LQEAKELGLVLEVHPPEQLMAAAHALAGRIAAAAPAAVSATLQMLRLQLPQHVLQEAARLEAKEQAGALWRELAQQLLQHNSTVMNCSHGMWCTMHVHASKQCL
jgi:enoyl-CoA hydratase/carnithine racemase